MLLLFGIFMINRFNVIRKQKKLIELQKKEAETQRLIAERRSEIIEEKQKEILDSIYYARRIQQALITNEFYIEKELKRLLKRKL